jgi:LemA protein
MAMNIIIYGVGAFVILVAFAIFYYNSFVHKRALVDEAWSGIDVQLKRRYDLIPNLVATVKGYSIHEKGVLEEVIRMRTASMGAVQVQDKMIAEAGLTQALKTLFAVVEQYPNLKANENFITLQKELSFVEHELQLARRYYNGTVRDYNTAITQFPAHVIAKSLGFSKAAYFEIGASYERETPKVDF